MQSHTFHDFDEFADSVRDVESKMLFRNAKQRVWSIDSVDLPHIDVQLGKLGSGNIASGQLREDGYMFYLPLSNNVTYSANGVLLKEDSLAILEPGCEFCISTSLEHDWFVAFVPSSMIPNGDPLAEPTGACRVTSPDRRVAQEFRRILNQILVSSVTCQEFDSSYGANCAEQHLLQLVTPLIQRADSGAPPPTGRRRLPRDEIIRRSMSVIEQSGKERVLVRDLVEVTNVSERTLRTTFNEYFLMGPIQYLQLRQIHQVHRALKVADPEAITVAEILVQNGVWEFSRFASRYRKVFGKCPSETLRARMPYRVHKSG